MDNIIPRIEKLVGRSDLNDFEKTFLPSIKSYYEKKNLLTPGQLSAFEKIEAKYSDEAQALHKAWRDSWDDQKKDNFKKIVDYYLNSVYYTSITRKVRENPEYVPTEKEYDTIVNNKYAQRYLKNLEIPAKYQVGDLIQIRSSWYRAGEIGTVIEVRVAESWVDGSRKYLVNLIGEDINREYEERAIKKFRESSLAKKKEKTV